MEIVLDARKGWITLSTGEQFDWSIPYRSLAKTISVT